MVLSCCAVAAASVEVAVVGCAGAVVEPAWVVMVVVDVRLVVKGFVVGFSTREPGLAKVVPAIVCVWSFNSGPEGSSTSLGAFVVANARARSSIVGFSDIWTVLVEVAVIFW